MSLFLVGGAQGCGWFFLICSLCISVIVVFSICICWWLSVFYGWGVCLRVVPCRQSCKILLFDCGACFLGDVSMVSKFSLTHKARLIVTIVAYVRMTGSCDFVFILLLGQYVWTVWMVVVECILGVFLEV